MAETAVGLFANRKVADTAVKALRGSGFPSDEIRVISKPVAMRVESATSMPSIDFAAGLARYLCAMGATEQECDAYVAGVRDGNVVVFATGTRAQADTAIAIMNGYAPIELKELAGAVLATPGVGTEDAASSSISSKVDDSRAWSEGARVFTW